eukprot:SAG22_NODE_6911_length_796_cov_0.718795_1_plen_238_part_01
MPEPLPGACEYVAWDTQPRAAQNPPAAAAAAAAGGGSEHQLQPEAQPGATNSVGGREIDPFSIYVNWKGECDPRLHEAAVGQTLAEMFGVFGPVKSWVLPKPNGSPWTNYSLTFATAAAAKAALKDGPAIVASLATSDGSAIRVGPKHVEKPPQPKRQKAKKKAKGKVAPAPSKNSEAPAPAPAPASKKAVADPDVVARAKSQLGAVMELHKLKQLKPGQAVTVLAAVLAAVETIDGS